ncbi:syntaxin-17 [Pimephales promelas]|nr:syntaxin-17 [Pimephales promelas]
MMAEEASKLPLRRLEPPILKFIKVAIPTDLERLHQHQHNIEKFQRSRQWEKLHQEHINSSRTVQQLRSNLREMEKLCGRVRSADAEALETLVQPIRDRASTAIQEFLQMHADAVNRPSFHETIGTDFHETITTDSDKLHSMCFPLCLCFMKLIKMCVVFFKAFSLSCDGLGYGETGVTGSSVTQTQLLLPEIPSEQNAAESWDTLQLRSNLREMEKLCGRVRSADAEALETLVQPIRDRASTAIQEFLQMHADAVNRPSFHETIGTDFHETITTDSDKLHSYGETGVTGSSVTQTQLLLPEIPSEQNAAESWDTLAEDLLELDGLVQEFSTIVHAQQEKIDSIEANVSIAAANVEEGTQSLGKAARLKLAVLPVAGAVVGGVLGGPLGLLAGFKVAGVAAAVGGGLLGFAGGNIIQRKRKEKIDLQLQQLKSNNNSKNDTQ